MGQAAARLPRERHKRHKRKASAHRTALWYGVHLPHLGLEIFERRHPSSPDERNRPTVLMDGKGVSLMNVPARDAGIAPGSTLATARSIAADLRHFNRDTDGEQRRLRLLAEAAYRYSPRVGIPAEDGLVLDAGPSLKLFGGAKALAAGLFALLRRLGHAARIAAARTPAASMVLARAGIPNVTADRSFDALRAAPLECAGAEIEARDIERLANMGIFQFGQLLDLPRDELGTRFGLALPNYLARLSGDAPDPVRPIVPREKFSSSVHLIESVSDKEALLFPMRRLVSELTTWLFAKELGVRSLIWRFEPLGGSAQDGCELKTRFADPRFDAEGILAVSKLELEGAEVPSEVMSVSLAVMATEPVRPEQVGPADLFGAKPASEALPMELVDMISARLGRGALQGLALADDHRPEFAWTPRSPSAKRNAPPAEEWFHPRPLWLFEPPRPIDIGHFQCLSGPERIESGWWGETVARDYFIAVHKSGAQCWIYANRKPGETRRCEDGQGERGAWFLHGYFA